MKYSVDVIFEHAVDLAHKHFRYSSIDELRFAMIKELKQVSHSQRLDDYLTEENIMYVFNCVWNLKWVEIAPLNHSLCDCGAKHSSFPEHHVYYCSVLNPDRIDLISMDGTALSLDEEEII